MGYRFPNPGQRFCWVTPGDGQTVSADMSGQLVAYRDSGYTTTAAITDTAGNAISSMTLNQAGIPDFVETTGRTRLWLTLDGVQIGPVDCDPVDYATQNQPATAAASPFLVTFQEPDVPVQGAVTDEFLAPFDCTVVQVDHQESVVPSSDLIVDLQRDTTGLGSSFPSVYTTAANRPKLAAGTRRQVCSLPDVTVIPAGSRVRAQFLQAAAAAAGLVLVGSAGVNAGGSQVSTWNIPIPSGTQAGDVLCHAITCGSGATVTPPTGWTVAASIPNAATNPTHKLTVLTKVASSSESTTQAVTFSTAITAVGGTVAVRNPVTNPLFVINQNSTGQGQSQAAPSATGSAAGELALIFFAPWYAKTGVNGVHVAVTPADSIQSELLDVVTGQDATAQNNAGLTIVAAEIDTNALASYTATTDVGTAAAWVSGQAHAVNDVVAYQGVAYGAKVAITANSTASTTAPAANATWRILGLFTNWVALAVSLQPAAGGPGRGYSMHVLLKPASA